MQVGKDILDMDDSGNVVQASMINRSRLVEDPIGYEERIWLSFTADSGLVLER